MMASVANPPDDSKPVSAPPEQVVTAAVLAGKLGLSRSTVSIVLRGDAVKRKISNATIERVLEAAREYDYIPNQIAQSLRRQRSGIVSIVVVNFRMDWCEELLSGALDVLDEAGVTPFVAAHRNSADRQQKELLAALRRRDDGVIVQPIPGQEEVYRRLQRNGIPLVFLGDWPVDMPEVSRVAWDSGGASATVVNHLVDGGRRKIGYIGHNYPLAMHIERYAAFERTLRQNNLPVNPKWIVQAPADTPLHDILDPSLRRMLGPTVPEADRPDALFFMNDGLALPALEVLQSMKVSVPGEVAIVGIGDLPLTGHSGISLTTVAEPVETMGREAAEVVLRLSRNSSEAPIHRLIHGRQLLVRATSGPRSAMAT